MKDLVFPRIADPAVSIIVLTRNGESGYLEDTLEALLQHTEPNYELLIVDNGSSDGTDRSLAERVQNATLVLNAVNRGFGPANNQGAARARSGRLLFLNDDLFVQPGWLEPLLTRVERDHSVGAVGPRVLNVDGSVQGEGALLTRAGGTVLHVGGGAYPFHRIVDYVAGACVLVRRSVFEEIGGFDPRYHPMYFEDADLCLAMRERGLLVVYEPRSVVTHVRGTSAFTRGERPLVPLRNRFRFERRWREVLAARPFAPLDNPTRRLAARDAPSASRILVIGERVEDTSMALELARMCVRSQITLASSVETPESEILAACGVEVTLVDDWKRCLGERRFHYDLVVGGSGEVLARVVTTQPQAVRLGTSEASKPERLAEAGIAVSPG
jgi:GT2 family glycosyltransferase